MAEPTGLITLLSGGGAGAAGVAFLAFILSGMKKTIDSKSNQETCTLLHKNIDEKIANIDKRLEKLDDIHETVIWMKSRMVNGGKI